MKVVTLIPYCPFPVRTGATSVFNKHLQILKQFDRPTILSACHKPVGFGWNDEHINALNRQGFSVVLAPRNYNLRTLGGLVYATVCKALRLERAFGHSNPYHRYAFPEQWFYEQTQDATLTEIHYSYWAHLPSHCPKVIIVHDLWSNIMWEGTGRETSELSEADLVVTVSSTDYETLNSRGIKNILWSPPLVEKQQFEDSDGIGIVGSGNRFNQEGLSWFQNAENRLNQNVHIFGGLAQAVRKMEGYGGNEHYDGASDPYRQCGVIGITTNQGTGVQIKAIEALAYGRAIVARKGAMRGIPDEEKGWVEVDTAGEMIEIMNMLSADKKKRREAMDRSTQYYRTYLNADTIAATLRKAYLDLLH